MIRPPPDGRFRFDLVGLGEISIDDVLLVDEPPPWGGKAEVRRRVRVGGGQIATAMYAAQRLGRRAALIGSVGAPPDGTAAIAELRAAGVDLSGVVPSSSGQTQQAVIVVDARGDRTVLFHLPAGAGVEFPFDPRRFGEMTPLVTAGRVVHLDGNHLPAAAHAARVAAEAGALVSLDLDRYEGAATEAVLAHAGVCLVAPAFMRALLAAEGAAPSHAPPATGDDDAEAAVAALPLLAARLPAGAIAGVTLGVRGAAVLCDGVLVRQPAFEPPEPIVDTTACGDTFRGALLVATLDGAELPAALRFATAAAALKTRDIGRLGCPDRAEVEGFLGALGLR